MFYQCQRPEKLEIEAELLLFLKAHLIPIVAELVAENHRNFVVVVLVDDFREAGDDFVLHRDGAGLQDLQDLVDEAFSGNGSAEPPELGQNELRQTSSGVDDGDVVVFERHERQFFQQPGGERRVDGFDFDAEQKTNEAVLNWKKMVK